MHPMLNRNVFLIKEQVGFMKVSNAYDVFDPESGEALLQCREERLGFFTKMFRFTRYRQQTPFDVQVRSMAGEPVLTVKRGVSIFLSKVDVLDENQARLGGFKQKFSLTGSFSVLGANDQVLCELKGSWLKREFRFVAGESELARVTQKWAGTMKELFTSADTYVLQISPEVPPDHSLRQLIFGAVMCIDMVYNE